MCSFMLYTIKIIHQGSQMYNLMLYTIGIVHDYCIQEKL